MYLERAGHVGSTTSGISSIFGSLASATATAAGTALAVLPHVSVDQSGREQQVLRHNGLDPMLPAINPEVVEATWEPGR